MAKTRIQLELKEKKKKKKYGDNYTPKSKNKITPIRVRIFLAVVCITSITSVIAIAVNSNRESNSTTETASESYNIDNKYIIDSNGSVTFLNGEEIVSSFPESYMMSIKAKTEDGESEYNVEVKDGIWYYYGTDKGANFNEVQIETDEYSMFLTKVNDAYVETDSLHYAYINGKDIVQSVLCGENISKNNNRYTSTIVLDQISSIFPYAKETVELTIEELEALEERNYEPEKLTTEVYLDNGVICVIGTGERSSFSMEIRPLTELTEDFSSYVK